MSTAAAHDSRAELEALVHDEDEQDRTGPALARPAVLIVRWDEQRSMVAFARPERPEDRATDPVAETGALLTAAVAASPIRRATLFLPVRSRDDHGNSFEQAVAATWLVRGDDDEAQPWSMGASLTASLADGGRRVLAPGSVEIPLDASPVASMLLDTTRYPSPGPLGACIDAVRRWGFVVVHTMPDDPPATAAQADAARHRLWRLARDLQRRHQPQAPHEVGRRLRSPVPVDLPTGFVPACPL